MTKTAKRQGVKDVEIDGEIYQIEGIDFFSWYGSEDYLLTWNGNDEIPDWLNIELEDVEGDEYSGYEVYAAVSAEPLPAGVSYREAVVRFEIPGDYIEYKFMQGEKKANLFLGNIDAAFDDLYLWNHDHLKLDSTANYNMVELTKDLITKFYTQSYQISRGYDSYGIVKEFHIDEVCPSDTYHMTPEIEPYMQCVQHFRRIHERANRHQD